MTWRDVEPTWNLVIGALTIFQLDCLSVIWVSCFFVVWDCIQVFMGYEPLAICKSTESSTTYVMAGWRLKGCYPPSHVSRESHLCQDVSFKVILHQ